VVTWPVIIRSYNYAEGMGCEAVMCNRDGGSGGVAVANSKLSRCQCLSADE